MFSEWLLLRAGVVDALGGMLKAHARRLVLSRKAAIRNATDFVEASRSLSVTLIQYTDAEISDVKQEFGEAWVASTSKIRYTLIQV